MDNSEWNGKYMKYGITDEPFDRLQKAITYSPEQFFYVRLWKIISVPDLYLENEQHDKIVENIISLPSFDYDIKPYYKGGGTEFFTGNPDEVAHILIDNEYELEEVSIEKIERQLRNSTMYSNKESIKQKLGIKTINEEDTDLVQKCMTQKWHLREYQKEAVQYATNKLLKENKIYIELATGGGKSYIAYNIMKSLKSEVILIVSPRKIVNRQNVDIKYTNLLGKQCHVIDFSSQHNTLSKTLKLPGIKVIVSCIQSVEKLWKYITNCNIRDIFVWFDEAHWALEDWNNTHKNDPRFLFLNDTIHIKYRLFTSASPNREVIQDNKDIFGELYRPIKVCELIAEKWLCSIRPYVYSEEKDDVNVVAYMLRHFIKNDKRFGLSFHYCQLSAFNMFYNHYCKYKSGETDIVPFLLVSDFSIPIDKMSLNENRNFHTSLFNFENTTNSIAYVVAQYSMGYDFDKIDLICFSDYKMSVKDIIQSVGRGTRSDGLGELGRNKKKLLDVLLPVFVKEESFNKFERIKEVLRYLVNEINIEFTQIIFIKNKDNETEKENQNNYEYNKDNVVYSEMLEWFKVSITQKACIKLLRQNGIHNIYDYNTFWTKMKTERPDLELPEYIFIKFPEFKWEDTYNTSPFYTKQKCIIALKQAYEDLLDDDEFNNIDDEDDKIEYLHKYDNKIPNQPYWTFYGGNKKDYM
jgi:hypothetical protein